MDLQRLIKFMNLTSSDSDNEALTALRMAVKLLKKDNLTWEKLLQGGGSRVEYRVEYRDRVVYKDRVVEKIVYRDAEPAAPKKGHTVWSDNAHSIDYEQDFQEVFEAKKPDGRLDRNPKPRADLAATRSAFARLSTETYRMTGSTLKWYKTITEFYNERGYITIRYLEMLQEFIRKME